jgi:sporulation protein YlmC with PRC-barrel domain
MLWSASAIKGYSIVASDGRLGEVNDLLFDDDTWKIRWLVVDTGKWLSGRKVLLPPSILGRIDPEEREFSVKVTMQQVKDSPGIDTDRPVSRQMETNIYDYYGWSPYWGNGLFTNGYGYVGGAVGADPFLGSRRALPPVADPQRDNDDLCLRSVEEVTGYHIHASDGEIGHVTDFLLEDADWSIRYLAVDTKNWWPGRKVLISPQSAREIDWEKRLVNLDVDRQKVKDSPAYDPSTIIDRAYNERFEVHYGHGGRSDDIHSATTAPRVQ